jgi:GAF domain-containing protein
MTKPEIGYFETFQEVGRAVLSVLSVREVTHLIAKRIVSALHLKASALLLVNEGSGDMEVAASHLLSRDFLSREPWASDAGIAEVRKGHSFLTRTSAEGNTEYGDFLRGEGIGSILSVPMTLGKEVIGGLRLYTQDEREYSDDALELISALAEIGAIAMDNARLFETKGAKLSELLEKGGVDFDCEPPLKKYRVRAVAHGEISPEKSFFYFHQLHRLAAMIALITDVDEILETTTREVAEVMDVKGCSLMWLNFATQELELLATYGLSRKYLSKGPLQMDRSIPQVLEGEVVVISDVQKDSSIQYPEAAEKEGIASILSIPIFVREKVRGVLRLYAVDARFYPPEDIEFVKALAEISGIAILNGKLHDAMRNDYAFWQSTMQYLGVADPNDADSP